VATVGLSGCGGWAWASFGGVGTLGSSDSFTGRATMRTGAEADKARTRISLRGRRLLESPTMSGIHDSILSTVGGTPIVRLARIGRGLPQELLGKCEFMNPGGSVKDRIGVRMLEDAEKAGRIKPGDTLIEATSGNTGIGLALAAAVRGYRMIITMPEKMSREKQVVLEALGAEIIRTPTEAAYDSPESHIGVARRLRSVIPNAHILDQYGNESNPLAHEEGTAAEIVEQTGGRIDAVVMTAGTGGTITGVARCMKKRAPHCKIIGVDPEGSILAGPGPIKSYKVEGIGYDFIPDVLKVDLVDRWVKSNDQDSFRVARQLIRQEGLLVGGSSGAAVWAAMQIAKDFPPGARILCILTDSVRNYLSKFVDDRWMRENGFLEQDWAVGTIAELLRAMPRREVITVDVADPLSKAVALFKERGFSQVPVTDHGKLAGILTEADALRVLVEGHANGKTSIAEVMVRKVSTIAPHAPANELPRIFERGEVALVVDEARTVLGLVTKLDMIEYLTRKPSV
jgi:cystathionine beta-synthase